MGHALGLGDHYTHNSNLDPYCCFTYGPAGTTIMDYPHVTTIANHDTTDLSTLYRIAPYNEWPLSASALNFHRINLGWGDRSHNERNHFVEEQPYGGSFSYVGDAGRDGTTFGREVSSPGYGYCYRTRPRNDWGLHGSYTSNFCVNTPHAVQNVIGAFGGGSNFNVCWDPAISGSGVTSFKILRQRWNNGAVTNTVSTVAPNAGCFGLVLFQGSVAAADWYHIAVRGCDASGVCSSYWDMHNPDNYWVWLPCWGNNSNCAYSSITSSWYHNH
jgi:hypothetical protein